ncbi:hypothetical protein QR680_011484 [Steinernema hermaphroditum]|uniref:Uncharacterized protein n=1 Tax=Steinernema hermaphroditum TaxID=289476 RepID=A0AA39I187_9BILA|nr:hypothetical protein QR680_011484 [Steinernema hermaphroditum]
MDGDMTKERFQEEVKKMVDELKETHKTKDFTNHARIEVVKELPALSDITQKVALFLLYVEGYYSAYPVTIVVNRVGNVAPTVNIDVPQQMATYGAPLFALWNLLVVSVEGIKIKTLDQLNNGRTTRKSAKTGQQEIEIDLKKLTLDRWKNYRKQLSAKYKNGIEVSNLFLELIEQNRPEALDDSRPCNLLTFRDIDSLMGHQKLTGSLARHLLISFSEDTAKLLPNADSYKFSLAQYTLTLYKEIGSGGTASYYGCYTDQNKLYYIGKGVAPKKSKCSTSILQKLQIKVAVEDSTFAATALGVALAIVHKQQETGDSTSIRDTFKNYRQLRPTLLDLLKKQCVELLRAHKEFVDEVECKSTSTKIEIHLNYIYTMMHTMYPVMIELYQTISRTHKVVGFVYGFPSSQRTGTYCAEDKGCVFEVSAHGGNDHRKIFYAVSADQNQLQNVFNLNEVMCTSSSLVCLADLNRYKKWGAFCFENDKVHKFFQRDVKTVYGPHNNIVDKTKFEALVSTISSTLKVDWNGRKEDIIEIGEEQEL